MTAPPAPRVLAVVPARYASTRYPGKPLVPLRGAGGTVKPLVQRSWEAACRAPGLDRVVIATDDDRIADAASGFGAEVVMTPESCANGTERCAAALDALGGGYDIVVNLQGDAPLTPPSMISGIVAGLARDAAAAMATPVIRATPEVHRMLRADAAAGRVGGTTAVFDGRGRALYFSKRILPYVAEQRADEADLPIFLHVGAYAYRAAALAAYAAARTSPLEELEGLEQLRFLAEGMSVACVEVERGDHWELNNPSDVTPLEALLEAHGIA